VRVPSLYIPRETPIAVPDENRIVLASPTRTQKLTAKLATTVTALGAERIEKSPRRSEWVTVKHDGRNVETLMVYPKSKDKLCLKTENWMPGVGGLFG
jgi:hypothetical protein